MTQPGQQIDIGANCPPSDEISYSTTASTAGRNRHAKDNSGGTPRLKAPIPIRPLPGLKLSFEALAQDTDDSVVAQVGHDGSSVPVSGQQDNELWRRFAGLSQSNADREPSTWDERERPLYPRISPGVSTRAAQLVSEPALENGPNPSVQWNASSGYQDSPSDDAPRLGSRLLGVPAATSGLSASHTNSDATFDSQGSSSLESLRPGSGNLSGLLGHPTDELYSRCQSHGIPQRNRGDAAATPSSEAIDFRGRYAHSDHGDTSEPTDSEIDSVDQRVAGLREAALKLVSRRNGTSRRLEKKSPQHSRPENELSPDEAQAASDSLVRYHPPDLDAMGEDLGGWIGLGNYVQESADGGHGVDLVQPSAPQEKAAGTAPEQSSGDELPTLGTPGTDSSREGSSGKVSPTIASPRKDSDDIWFNYVFSDTNTEDLHKEVLHEAAKESARNLHRQAGKEDTGRIFESETGYNISTAATGVQTSIGPTQSDVDNDLTSSYGVGASHNAAIGSPIATTQTTGAAFDGWEGCGGPPYAAQSMQGLASSGATALTQQDSNYSGACGRVMSEGATDVLSSLSSNFVEPPQSVKNNVTKETFMFAPPRLFVGKLSTSVPSERPITALKPVTLMKPRRGRPRKKTRDGRANIRGIPVIYDDPIEDFDEAEGSEVRDQGRSEPSLFGALETD